MATTFTGTLSGGLTGSYAKGTDLTSVLEAINFAFSSSYTNGTGSNQVNAFFSDTRTLAATNESHDLNTMTDSFGATLNFLKVKFLYVKNKSTTTVQTLTLTGDFLTQAGVGVAAGGFVLGPSGIYMLDNPIDGYTVTATTADVITLTNAASFDYDILILGTI